MFFVLRSSSSSFVFFSETKAALKQEQLITTCLTRLPELWFAFLSLSSSLYFFYLAPLLCYAIMRHCSRAADACVQRDAAFTRESGKQTDPFYAKGHST